MERFSSNLLHLILIAVLMTFFVSLVKYLTSPEDSKMIKAWKVVTIVSGTIFGTIFLIYLAIGVIMIMGIRYM